MIRVLLFARVRERAGKNLLEMAWSPGMTAGILLETLRARDPVLAEALKAPLLVAVNQEMTDWAHALQEDDEVALFPPVTGG